MTERARLPSSLVRVICAALLACLMAAPASAAKRALLIGINEYASPQVPNLRGAVNDIHLMARTLETRFGFEADDIRMLTDGDATRSAILAALDELVDSAHPDDTVYLHFSGHGSRVVDLSGDEADGFDETILPHDARTEGIADIIDDELDLLFDRIKANTVFMVFDSCHSGTVTRSAALSNLTRRYGQSDSLLTPVIVRAVPPDHRLALYAPDVVPKPRTRAVVPVERLNHVLMASAPSEHEAYDGPVGEGWYGLFSYSLARSMEALGPEASALELHDRARAELRDVQARLNVLAPVPQLEGPASRLQLPPLGSAGPQTSTAGAASPPLRSWVPATRLVNGQVRLHQGAVLGALPGSQWALYDEQETSFEFGRALASGTVQSLQDDDAILVVQQQATALPPSSRAVRLTSADAWTSVPVRFLAVPAHRVDTLLAAVQDSVPEVILALPGQHARFLIELSDDRWTIWDAGGLAKLIDFADSNNATVAELIQGTIGNASSALALLAVDNPASDIDLRVAIIDAAQAEAVNPAVRGVVIRPSDSQPSYRFRRGEEPRSAANSLMLEILADRPGYLSIVHVDPAGRSALLFPNDYQKAGFLPDGHIPGGARVRIPDTFSDNGLAGFHWDYGPPEGRDTLRIFFAEDLSTAQAVRSSVAVRTRSALTPIRQMNRTLNDHAMRGVVLRPSPALDSPAFAPAPASAGWTARTVVIDVLP